MIHGLSQLYLESAIFVFSAKLARVKTKVLHSRLQSWTKPVETNQEITLFFILPQIYLKERFSPLPLAMLSIRDLTVQSGPKTTLIVGRGEGCPNISAMKTFF